MGSSAAPQNPYGQQPQQPPVNQPGYQSYQGYQPPQPGYPAAGNPAGAGGYNGNPYGSYVNRTPVKTDHSLLTYILLSILTCGIYGYYIIYKLAQDVNQMCAEDGQTIGGLGEYILFTFLTCGLYSIYWLYKIQNRMYAAAPRYRVMITENGSNVLIWYLVGMLICGLGSFISMNIVFKSANNLGNAYNAMYFYNR